MIMINYLFSSTSPAVQAQRDALIRAYNETASRMEVLTPGNGSTLPNPFRLSPIVQPLTLIIPFLTRIPNANT